MGVSHGRETKPASAELNTSWVPIVWRSGGQVGWVGFDRRQPLSSIWRCADDVAGAGNHILCLRLLHSLFKATARTFLPALLHVGGILRRPDTAQPDLCSIVSVTGPASLADSGWQGIKELPTTLLP